MRDEREQRILDAAQRLVLHYGYDKTTISDIAKEADIAKGTVYLHFDSKDDLFEALLWREIWNYTDKMVSLLEAIPQEKWSFITMYEQAMFAFVGCDLLQAMLRDDTRVMGSFMRRRGDKFVKMKQPMRAEMLELMQQSGAIRADVDIQNANHLIAALSYGMMNMHMTVPPNESMPTLESLIPLMSEMLERWLVPADGGNREAAQKIIMQIIASFKKQYEGKEMDRGDSDK